MDLYPAGAIPCSSLSGQHKIVVGEDQSEFCGLCGLLCDNGMTDGLRLSQSEMPLSKTAPSPSPSS